MNEQQKPYDKYIASGEASKLAQAWRNEIYNELIKKHNEEFPFSIENGELVAVGCRTNEPSNELKKLSVKAVVANQYLLDICAAEQTYRNLVAIFDD